MKKIAIIAILASLAAISINLLNCSKPTTYSVSSQNHESCLYGAVRAREGFKGTQFEDWNFYESCLLNIECANPIPECPTKEIHEASKFFNNYQKGNI